MGTEKEFITDNRRILIDICIENIYNLANTEKGDTKECSNYRRITLTSIPVQVLTKILEKILLSKTGNTIR